MLICRIKYCKSLYIYTYLIRPWLDKSQHNAIKTKSGSGSAMIAVFGVDMEIPMRDKKKDKLACTSEKRDLRL